MEKNEMNKLVEFYKDQDRKQRENQNAKNRRYGQDLLDQIDYLHMEKREQKDFDSHEYESYLRAENDYQNRVTKTIKQMEEYNSNLISAAQNKQQQQQRFNSSY